MHYYQFNIGDFIKDSAHLSLEEEAIYRRLIDHYYTTEKPISLDISVVSRAIRARGSESLIELILNEFFIKTEKGFKQKRIEKELKKFKDKSKMAKASAQARWNKGSSKKDNNANAMRTHSEGNANHKPITNNHKPNSTIVIPDGINKELFSEWLEYRKSKKKPVSQVAAKKQFKLLAKYSEAEQELIINKSIQNDYQGLFELRANNENTTRNATDDIDFNSTGWSKGTANK